LKMHLVVLTKSPMHKEINGVLTAGVCVVAFCPETGRLFRLIQEPDGSPLNGKCVRQFSVMDEIEAEISREYPAPPQTENVLIPAEGITRIGRSSLNIRAIEQMYIAGLSEKFMDHPDAVLDCVAEYDHSVEILRAEDIRFIWYQGTKRPQACFRIGNRRYMNYRVTDPVMELREPAACYREQEMDAADLVISIPNIPFAKDGKYYKFVAAVYPAITNRTETADAGTPEQILKEYYGYDSFRPGQRDVIENLMAGRDCLCVMPTGQGKSLCYQIPAMLLRGTALVISPLISLMKDQTEALVRAGIPAACLYGQMDAGQQSEVLKNIAAGKYKLVYTTPERLSLPRFQQYCATIRLSLIAVDEAHCVSQWGPNFRYEYLKINDFISQLPGRPVVGAFTATATEKVAQDICYRLQLRDPFSVRAGFDRPNLYFGVVYAAEKLSWLRAYLSARGPKSGIVYCSTRSTVERVYESLAREGYPVSYYHAGLSSAEREKNQDDFSFDRKPVMIATNAFGMGIDKPNVSFVIHYNIPKSMEAYYQEAGRAGRDGEAADCILLYSPSDLITNRRLIDNDIPSPDLTPEEAAQVRQSDLLRLNQMAEYAEGTGCLRSRILNYFGDKSAPSFCGNCSDCKHEYEIIDAREEAKMILSCVARTGQRYGKDFIAHILKGKATERHLRLGMDQQTTWGLMNRCTLHEINRMITELISREYLFVPVSDYPILQLTGKSREMLFGDQPFLIRKINSFSGKKKKQRAADTSLPAEMDNVLYEKLRARRNETAAEEGIPPYIILDNKTLMEIASVRPVTEEEFLRVKGIGRIKSARYASLFIPIVKEYVNRQSEK